MRSYGADEVFDYRSPTCVKDIRRVTRNCLKYALDPFGEIKTMSICIESIGRAGGRYSALEQFQEDICDRRTVSREFTIGATIIGEGCDFGGNYMRPPRPELRVWGIAWYQSIQRLVDQNRIKAHPIRVLKGGFDDILQGLSMLSRKEISAEKLVVSLGPKSNQTARTAAP